PWSIVVLIANRAAERAVPPRFPNTAYAVATWQHRVAMQLSRPQHPRSDLTSCCRRADFWAKSTAAMSTASLERCRSEKFRHWLSTDRRVTFAAKWLLCSRLRLRS